MAEAACVVCGGEARLLADLPAARLRAALARWYGVDCPPAVEIRDYRLLRCRRCTLEFADPMVPGGEGFYSWVTATEGYYSGARWEYEAVLARLPRRDGLRLLDVGCGAGDFLAAAAERGIAGEGIDTTGGSVAACRTRGIEASIGDLESWCAANAGRTPPVRYDAVVAFHVLEHLADPVAFLASAASLLAPAGVVFLSVPYSPLSYEAGCFFPLNQPPHHLTRWNATSLGALGKRAGLGIRIRAAPVDGPLRRGVQALRLGMEGRRPATRGAILRLLARHPVRACGAVLRQLRRERLDGAPAPDLVLAELAR